MTRAINDEKNNHHYHDSLGILTQRKKFGEVREKNSQSYLALSLNTSRIKVRGEIYYYENKKLLSCLNAPFLEQWLHLIHSCILLLLDFVRLKVSLLYFLSPYYPLQNFVLQRKLSYSCQPENPYLLRFVLQLQPLNSFPRLLPFFGPEPPLVHL